MSNNRRIVKRSIESVAALKKLNVDFEIIAHEKLLELKNELEHQSISMVILREKCTGELCRQLAYKLSKGTIILQHKLDNFRFYGKSSPQLHFAILSLTKKCPLITST